MHTTKAIGFIGLYVTICRASFAAVIWDQPRDGQAATNITLFAAANDFSVTSPTRLTGMRVWLTDTAQVNEVDGVFDTFNGTLGWAILNDVGALPGSVRFSGSDHAPTVTTTNSFNAVGREIFEVDAVFRGSPILAPGTYWLAVREGTWGGPRDSSVVGWEVADSVKLDFAAVFNLDTSTGWRPANRDIDHAVQLRADNAIPEPSCLTVWFFVCVVGFGVWRRRRLAASQL
jgi:hypothetical protein